MKAIQYIKYGTPEVASPFVTRFFGGFFKPKNIPGDMLAGKIAAIGKNVKGFNIGQRIYGTTGPSMGAHAQYTVINQNEAIVNLPENVSFEDASSIADGAITAYPFLLETGKLKSGQHILINGGSGSIGSYAIQLAKLMDATVTAVCSTKNISLVENLGADFSIDYTKEDFTKYVAKYDIIFDTVGKSSFKKSKGALTNNGIYMSTIPSLGLLIRSIFNGLFPKKAMFSATGLRKPKDKVVDFKYLAKLADNGKLKSIIDKVYNLEDIKKAHVYVDQGHKVGNVIVKFW